MSYNKLVSIDADMFKLNPDFVYLYVGEWLGCMWDPL